MPVEKAKLFSPDVCKAFPNKIFVFGDNDKRKGKGGQAIIRDEPNAFGIATKKAPYVSDWAFYNDTYIYKYLEEWSKDFVVLRAHHISGHIIVFPEDGLGTGLAMLPTKAPRSYALLTYLVNDFCEACK